MTKLFKVPFATQGDRTAIPDDIRADGAVSYTQGYGYDYERDQATDPAAKDIEREKMNSLFHDITEAVGEMQSFGVPVWQEAGKPYAVRSTVYHKNKTWQSKIENNTTEPAAGTAWAELKADITAGETGAYSKGECDQKFQPAGNYLPEGYSYSKAESDTAFQPKGNYAPAGNYALKTDVYTKTEGDGRYQPKGNYQPAGEYAVKGESYTRPESDTRYQPKGNYQAADYSYSKTESDGRYQPKGNYAPAGNYVVKGDSYTKAESDNKYQAKGNYQAAGYSYSKAESDNKYQPKGNYQSVDYSYSKSESDVRYGKKGAAKGWRWVGGYGNASSSISMSEDVRGKQLYFQLTGSGGSNWTTVCLPPVDNIGLYFFQGTAGWGIVCTQDSGRILKSIGGQYIEWSSIYVAD